MSRRPLSATPQEMINYCCFESLQSYFQKQSAGLELFLSETLLQSLYTGINNCKTREKKLKNFKEFFMVSFTNVAVVMVNGPLVKDLYVLLYLSQRDFLFGQNEQHKNDLVLSQNNKGSAYTCSSNTKKNMCSKSCLQITTRGNIEIILCFTTRMSAKCILNMRTKESAYVEKI